MTGLRGLVEKATPGPWVMRGIDVVSQADHLSEEESWVLWDRNGTKPRDWADARLIALAPDLALWAADAAAARTYSFSARSWMAAKRASRCGKTERY